MHYVAWALLGMAGYSLTTLFVKLAMRGGELNVFVVLALSTGIVGVTVWTLALTSGGFTGKTAADFARPSALYTYAAGVALAVAVTSLFKWLAGGPASVVVPIYGMFILGGALLGILVLGEPLTAKKTAGLLLAVAGIYLVAT